MPPGIGYSFSPTGQDIPVDDGNSRFQGMSPQQAVKMISLRVPHAAPPNAPINNTLMNSAGGSGAPGGGLGAVLQQLMKMFQPGLDPGAGTPGGPVAVPPQDVVTRPGGVGNRTIPGQMGEWGPGLPSWQPPPQPPPPPRIRPGGDDELPEPPPLADPGAPQPPGLFDVDSLYGAMGRKRDQLTRMF